MSPSRAHVSSQSPAATRSVRLWLIAVALMIGATAVVGAATRLTGSGLSITEWRPIMGALPPLTEADWQGAFAKYKEIPQYKQLNASMSLAAFKTIFWWEWGHRLLGRAIGAVFLLPFLVLAWRRAIPARLGPRLVLIFLLGGLQGAIGWYMVSSGLVERTSVSQYRLALHLGVAVAILGLVVWTILDLDEERHRAHLATLTPGDHLRAGLLMMLTFLQVLLGALVAGLKAGMTYNTWPLMDGWLWPGGLWSQSPAWVNAFENAGTVQFDHRLAAYLLVLLGLWHAIAVIRRCDDERVRHSAGLLAAGLLGQTALGIWTLLAWVPLQLGITHQAGALAVWTLAVWHLYAVRRAGRGV